MSSELIKVSAVIIVVAVFATVLRNRLGEYAILLVIATISILLVFIFAKPYFIAKICIAALQFSFIAFVPHFTIS